MEYTLIIDNREKYIKKFFEKHTDLYPNIIYKNLDLGDIIITENNIPLIIIERKTIPDLLASIKDGRYKEQKKRIKESNIKYKIYLIEDDPKYHKKYSLSVIDKKTIVSSTLSTLIQEINVIKTQSFEDTINYIETLYNKLIKSKKNTIYDYLNNTKTTDNNDIITNILDTEVSLKKKSNDPLTCFKNQLCQIPSISNVASNILLNHYKNMNELICALNTEDKWKVLEDLTNGKSKTRIGEKKAEKIYEYLFNSL